MLLSWVYLPFCRIVYINTPNGVIYIIPRLG
nr:MAG TPA: hypothetical protein [Inoviridae sp.]